MKVFCPLPRRFAVIQMDPVGMVKHFDDPIALAAAQAMRPKKYLVYLRLPLELSTPTKPWFRYEVYPIATIVRPEDNDEGITSDMVIPIYPNTSHARGRSPIRTETPFPFPNCYHWIKNRFVVRIRRKAIRYDDTCAVMLGIREHLTLDRGFNEDYDRIHAFQREKLAALEHVPADAQHDHHDRDGASGNTAPGACTPESHVVDLADDDVDSLPEGCRIPDDLNDGDTSSISTQGSDHPSVDTVAAIVKLDIFGFSTDDTVELIPLVDLWYELTDHLTAETIPSPVELYKEWDTIMQIIHDARERAPPDRTPFVDSGVAIDYDDLSILREGGSDDSARGELLQWTGDSERSLAVVDVLPPSQPRSFGLSRAWKQLVQKARRPWRRPISWVSTRLVCLSGPESTPGEHVHPPSLLLGFRLNCCIVWLSRSSLSSYHLFRSTSSHTAVSL
ncbi:hypothetical protein OH77DRAFT_1430797 [Trametes cingulata]|nr:hypothetical protein OH77DRAFT_1430797 [Trametes cingulata]